MVHLEVHSYYSLLEGAAGIEALVGRAASCSMNSLAITDTGGLYGVIPFYKAARAASIKAILGVKLGSAVLLARDNAGYECLCELVTAFHMDDAFDLIEGICGCSSHIFAITSDRELIADLYNRGVEPLVAITHYGDPQSRYRAGQLRDFADSMRLRAVAVNPVYFLDAKHARIHRVLSAIRLNTTVSALGERDVANPGAWFRSREDMERLYCDWTETLANTRWVADNCNVELGLGKTLFPKCTLPKDETAFSYLWKLSFDGLKERYRPLIPEHTKRLEYELDVINQLGFASYFLIVWDIVRYARAEGIAIVGRGSAANSLVAYVLGITRVDPFKYDLYFERFLNVFRTDCPDIDLDICWRRRDEVIGYVYEKYGADRVAMICTFNTFKARSALREVAKTFGITHNEISRIVRYIPHYAAKDVRTVLKALPECRHIKMDKGLLGSVLEISEFIDGFPRHLSIHSGGLVIAPEPLTRFVPLQISRKGIVITQYEMGAVEDLGLVKMDLLGHRSLSVIVNAVEKIHEGRGILIDVDNLPDSDKLTGALIRTGQTIGCFQIESPAMRSLLQNTAADNVDMLIKTLSLVRPGPSGSGMKKRFIARHAGREKTEYLHPLLEKVLADTYGVMLYQEDILKVASVIAGMNLAEADSLRRAISKKGSPEKLAVCMKVFLEKAVANGVEECIAEEIWAIISNFARYSYCKAHACTYGEIAYQCTYLKAHFPAEFLAAVLSNKGGFYGTSVYVEEAKRRGINILLPDVNKSDIDYTATWHGTEKGSGIRVGLSEIHNLKRSTMKKILKARKIRQFKSIEALCQRTGGEYADIEALIDAGACDCFGKTRPELLWELKLVRRKSPAGILREQFIDYGNSKIFLCGFEQGGIIPILPDYSRKRRFDLEKSTLGFWTSTHPIEYCVQILNGTPLVLSSDLGKYCGDRISMLGRLIAERRLGLKGRGCMKFLSLEDISGVFEAVLFPRVYQRYGNLLGTQGPYLVTGEVKEEDNHCSLVVESLRRIDVYSGPARVHLSKKKRP